MKNKKDIPTSTVKEKLVEQENKTEISRRNFLKKTAYSAPVLMAMGQLVKPQSLHAEYNNEGCADPSFLPCG